MNYVEWELSVPNQIKDDILWKVKAFRLSLFLTDIGWHDVTKLMSDKRTIDLSDQLYRALGSISSNIAEGYSRHSGKDQARFYEYALGSARECRVWYYNGRHVLGEAVSNHRLELLTNIIRLLLTTIPGQRTRRIRESTPIYSNSNDLDTFSDPIGLANLLDHVPLP